MKYLKEKVSFTKGDLLIAGVFAIVTIASYIKDYNKVVDKAAHLGQYLANEKGLTADELKDISEGKYESHID